MLSSIKFTSEHFENYLGVLLDKDIGKITIAI